MSSTPRPAVDPDGPVGTLNRTGRVPPTTRDRTGPPSPGGNSGSVAGPPRRRRCRGRRARRLRYRPVDTRIVRDGVPARRRDGHLRDGTADGVRERRRGELHPHLRRRGRVGVLQSGDAHRPRDAHPQFRHQPNGPGPDHRPEDGRLRRRESQPPVALDHRRRRPRIGLYQQHARRRHPRPYRHRPRPRGQDVAVETVDPAVLRLDARRDAHAHRDLDQHPRKRRVGPADRSPLLDVRVHETRRRRPRRRQRLPDDGRPPTPARTRPGRGGLPPGVRHRGVPDGDGRRRGLSARRPTDQYGRRFRRVRRRHPAGGPGRRGVHRTPRWDGAPSGGPAPPPRRS